MQHFYLEWLTVNLLAEAERALSTSSIRYLIFQSEPRCAASGETIPGNGLAPAIRRVGRKVLLNHGLFLDWVAGKDISQIDPSALMRDAEWLPNGKREGQEPVSRHPTRDDSTPGSFKINLSAKLGQPPAPGVALPTPPTKPGRRS